MDVAIDKCNVASIAVHTNAYDINDMANSGCLDINIHKYNKHKCSRYIARKLPSILKICTKFKVVSLMWPDLFVFGVHPKTRKGLAM